MHDQATMEMPGQGRQALLVYGLLWSLGLYLRLTVLIVPPLIPQLKAGLGFSSGEVAIATSLPLVTLALGGLATGWMLARLGVKACLLGGLAIMALGSAMRSLPDAFLPFMLATILMGAGIAFMQAAMPVLAKLWAPQRIGRASAVYTNGLLVGELLAAGVTAPLAEAWLGDAWQWAFALWVLPVPLLMLALIVGARALPETGGGSTAARLMLPDVGDGRTWRLVALLGCAAALYFCGNVFLPPILESSDRLTLLAPSLTALNGAQMLSSALLIVWADRLMGRHRPLMVIAALALLTLPAMLWLPGAGVVWAAGVFGFFTSALFIFVLALPAWLVSVERLPRLMSGMLCFGYLLVFAITVVGGWLNDATGIVALAFLPTLAISLVAMAGMPRLLASREKEA
ncbi:MFS transporter [Halomonas organivorans]|uniref:CP family cyanate transporter-like MFS transporter n=1 Tax=Halomonas organivorans TaxID=257772 RepID=A0A7W5BV11_9GAMM|nr:MFS transporter [Halomonas organivorans]MBB3139646.1 CP family cyanate transporter-like MFS transporter [Halomonas organivorans]